MNGRAELLRVCVIEDKKGGTGFVEEDETGGLWQNIYHQVYM